MMKKKRLDCFALKMDSFDTEPFSEDVISYSMNSMIIVFNFHKITVKYKPDNIKLRWTEINYLLSKGGNFIRPLRTMIATLQLLFIVAHLCIRYRPRVVWTENVWVSVLMAMLKKLGVCDFGVFCSGDWLATKQKQSLVSLVANNFMFPHLDYWACKLNDVVLNYSEHIARARQRFWNKSISNKEYYYPIPITINPHIDEMCEKNCICFLGQVRTDSGLELLVPLLPSLNERHGIRLKIVGPETFHLEKIRQLVSAVDADRHVEYVSYIKNDEISRVLADCFCGTNLMTSKNSYSSYTIPGKLIHYLQMLMPLVVTEGVGPFKAVVIEKGLGFVTAPVPEKIEEAILGLFTNQKCYQKRIRRYIENRTTTKISDYFGIKK